MNQPINQPSLEQVIDRVPLTINPNATALSAIAFMCQPNGNHDAPTAIESSIISKHLSRNSYSYILVLEKSKPIGILTEHDVVRLTASGINLADVQVSAVMTQPIITLSQTNDQDVSTALSFLRQHHICHLPIIDKQGLLLGMVTERDLLQLFDPLLVTASCLAPPTGQQNIAIDHQQHELLRQSQQDLSDFVENAIFGLHWVAADGTIIWANQAELDLLGYTREEYIGHSITEFHADQEIIADILQRLLSNQLVQEYEADLRCKDGSIRRVLIDSNSSWRDGEFVRTRCFTRDITDRKRAEEALRQSEQKFRAIFDGMFQFMGVLTPEGILMEANQTALDAVAATLEDVVGKMFWATQWWTHSPLLQEQLKDAIARAANGELVRFEAEHILADTTTIFVDFTLKPVFDEVGKVIMLIPEGRDITDRKQAELELQSQKQDLARSNAELQQFAYVASHDLQEPLRMITSYLELLERRYKGQLDERADKFIAYAVDGATRMQTLINDLLSYSRVGTSTKDWTSVDCEKIVQNVLSNLRLSIVQSHAVITHDPLPKVNADPSQLTQLFQNLISNAIKFHREAEAPQIHIGVNSTDDKWLFSVQDNGIGMEVQYLERIFIIFQRLHGKTEYPGTGIGLAVCKKIVERHGGNLWVESQPDHGSTFSFTLPQTAGNS